MNGKYNSFTIFHKMMGNRTMSIGLYDVMINSLHLLHTHKKKNIHKIIITKIYNFSFKILEKKIQMQIYVYDIFFLVFCKNLTLIFNIKYYNLSEMFIGSFSPSKLRMDSKCVFRLTVKFP